MCLATIPTTTSAKRQPTTRIEFDRGVLLIAKGRAIDLYTVEEFATTWDGRAFYLTKDGDPDRRAVFIADGFGSEHSRCECAGFLHTGRCKHVDALTALERGGELPPAFDVETNPEPLPREFDDAECFCRGDETCDNCWAARSDELERIKAELDAEAHAGRAYESKWQDADDQPHACCGGVGACTRDCSAIPF